MSWKEISSVVRRLEFAKLALKAHQSMSLLCRRFGMSRRTGYKWLARFEREGRRGLRDRTSRPHHSPQRTSPEWLSRIRHLRRRHRSWGGKKLAARLRKQYPGQAVPVARTIDKWLKRMRLIGPQRRRSPRGPRLKRAGLTLARRSNQVWTVDFKGWFRTADGQRVDPLTVRDLFSRYVLAVHLLKNQSGQRTRRVFLRLFRKYGYPTVIRTDNGEPFAGQGPAGLTRLSAWWTALGIRVEFTMPRHPEQNGAHEQMHRVLKAETTQPASSNLRAQQRRTGRWVMVYNQMRPHQGLGQRVPAEVYCPKPTQIRSAEVSYPRGLAIRRVRRKGQIKWQGRERFVGEGFIGYPVGLKLKSREKCEVYFAGLLIGELWESDAGGIRPATYARPVRPA